MPDLRTHRHRVAQWATGTIGTHALRSIIEHPHLELSGVHVFGAGEVGTDAGDLCGLAPTGVTATDRIEAILDAAPDCVLYMPAAPFHSIGWLRHPRLYSEPRGQRGALRLRRRAGNPRDSGPAADRRRIELENFILLSGEYKWP